MHPQVEDILSQRNRWYFSSIKTLPTEAIASLAKVLDASDDPFGANFMHGLVAPLSKAGSATPRSDQTRPITILPQLYRLWASVICSQIAAAFALWAPPSITGFLPARGSVTAALNAQFAIEHSRYKGIAPSGLVLDLRKCFNNVDWSFAFHALHACGVPLRFLRTWILMISSMVRHWMINGEVFLSGTGTSGIPEGDQWSVLAMVAISIGWITYLEANSRELTSLSLTAYADNWGWFTPDYEVHPALLTQTQHFTAAAGLSLDWSKTWYWSTSKSHARLIEQSLDGVTPVKLTQKLSATDLGFQMQYGLRNSLGVHSDRLADGITRISRLAGLPCSLSVKEHLLQTSVYPVVFHGTETKPPVQDSFAKLRSVAARSLYGDAHTISPAIALLFGKKGILDPEFVYVVRLLSTIRRFVASLPDQTALDFFRMASRFHGSLGSVHGPAASLAFTLQQLGWQIDACGQIHVTAFLSFGLLSSSVQRFRRFLSLSWQYQLVKLQTCRYSWYQFPDISVVDTRAVLNEFPDNQRRLLIREISGGYQLETQKQHWAPDQTGQCPFCPAEDSRRHRLLDCPLGLETRTPFQSVLLELEHEGSVVPDFPVVCVHPSSEALLHVHFRRSPTTWGPAVIHILHELAALGLRPNFYTDGSCQFPMSPTTRYAAWSVVLDLCRSDTERLYIADSCRYTEDYVKVFHTVSTDLADGEQDILRSELLAICEICENTEVGDIYVDSQSAIQLATMALTATSTLSFLDREHFDVLLRIFRRQPFLDIQLHKVKSHVDISAIEDPFRRFHAMGNAFADAVAETTRDKKLPPFVAEHVSMNKELLRDKQLLTSVFTLHLQLFALRGKAQQQVSTDTPLVESQTLWDLFRNWEVPNSVFQMPELNTELLSYCAFGQDIAEKTIRWLRCLRWPPEVQGPGSYNVGTTWIELALDWMCYNK